MRKKNYEQVENKPAVLSDGTPVKDVYVRWLIDDEHDGAKNFAMRRFEIKPKTEVPLHGDVIYIAPNEKHGITNLGNNDFIFLCSVPYLKE
jgi:quercetin dioxygenase-like cupin family protein